MFIDSDGRARDFIQEFINDEYVAFPVSLHDDMLDCIARIIDEKFGAQFPIIESNEFDSFNNTIQTEYDVL